MCAWLMLTTAVEALQQNMLIFFSLRYNGKLMRCTRAAPLLFFLKVYPTEQSMYYLVVAKKYYAQNVVGVVVHQRRKVASHGR